MCNRQLSPKEEVNVCATIHGYFRLISGLGIKISKEEKLKIGVLASSYAKLVGCVPHNNPKLITAKIIGNRKQLELKL